MITLQALFGSPVHLANSFDGHEGAAVLIRQVHANTGENVVEDEAGRIGWLIGRTAACDLSNQPKREMAFG